VSARSNGRPPIVVAALRMSGSQITTGFAPAAPVDTQNGLDILMSG